MCKAKHILYKKFVFCANFIDNLDLDNLSILNNQLCSTISIVQYCIVLKIILNAWSENYRKLNEIVLD